MELILYYIRESTSFLLLFLLVIFLLAAWCYLVVRKFRQDSRWKVTFYGLFFRIKNIDLVKLSCVVIRTFLVIYTALVFTDSIYVYLIMIIIISILYIVLSYKRFIYELVCAIIQVITDYFIYVLNDYMLEMQYSVSLNIVQISLKVFVIIFAMYFFFKNIFDIVENRNNHSLKESGKVIDKT